MKSLKSQLEKSTQLAHLSLTEKEKDELTEDLEKIIGFVEVIDKHDAEEASEGASQAELSYPQLAKKNVWREDVIDPFENKEALLRVIPDKKENLIKVKKI